MNFGGIHMHMVLVVGLICVVIYVFYVSKDIVSLDKEVRLLKAEIAKMNLLQNYQSAGTPGTSTPPPMPMVVDIGEVVQQVYEQTSQEVAAPLADTDEIQLLEESVYESVETPDNQQQHTEEEPPQTNESEQEPAQEEGQQQEEVVMEETKAKRKGVKRRIKTVAA